MLNSYKIEVSTKFFDRWLKNVEIAAATYDLLIITGEGFARAVEIASEVAPARLRAETIPADSDIKFVSKTEIISCHQQDDDVIIDGHAPKVVAG